MTSTTTPDRLVALANVHNFRDMGGYRTRDGRTTKWRTLYRADGLYRLDDADVERLRPLGLRTVIDLRTEHEMSERGRFPFEVIPVEFHHVSIIDRTWQEAEMPIHDVSDTDFLVGAYRHMLSEGMPRMATALHLIANEVNAPLVFHCAAGKDRTGLVAMLTLAALDVIDEDILDDYAQTRDGMERMRQWARNQSTELFERMQASPTMFMAAEPDALAVILDDLRTAHGSMHGFLDSIGIDAAVRQRLTAHLLD